jgi:hypothetical protein
MTLADLALVVRLAGIAFIVLLVVVIELAEQLWRTRRRPGRRRPRGRYPVSKPHSPPPGPDGSA